MTGHTCPCCGYTGLDCQPYERPVVVPALVDLKPPYEVHFGAPSYEVCECCGFEFGNDDNPGTRSPVSFAEYLAEWVEDGAVWFYEHRKPEGWELEQQLAAAGISAPLAK